MWGNQGELLDITHQFESANEAHPGRSLCCIEDVQLIGAALPIISTEKEDFVPLEARSLLYRYR